MQVQKAGHRAAASTAKRRVDDPQIEGGKMYGFRAPQLAASRWSRLPVLKNSKPCYLGPENFLFHLTLPPFTRVGSCTVLLHLSSF